MTTEPKIEQVDHDLAERANAIWSEACGGPDIPAIAASLGRALGKQEGRQELLAEVLAWLRAYRGWESIVSTAQFFADALEAKFGR